tara:strand:- start:297 stop:821 length:525 start_codon:yes stop_codon:yes gene_type:complete
MSSVLKVDTIQTTAGAAPTTKDLGFAAGSVIQVVKSGNFQSAHVYGTSSSYASMGSDFSLAITPKFNNSVILIEAMLNPYTSGSNNSGTYNISKDGGSSFIAANNTNGFGIVPTHGTASGTYSHFIISASDTVSSTSTVTYQIYFRSDNSNNNVTFYGNHANMSNHITLMEIAQ